MIIKKGDKFECIKDVIMDNNPPVPWPTSDQNRKP